LASILAPIDNDLEGGVTIGMAIITFLVLPLHQSSAWFLSKAEREHSIHRMDIDVMKNLEVYEDGNVIKESRMISMRDIKDVLKDWKKLIIVVFNILATLPVSAFGTFLPLVVKGQWITKRNRSSFVYPVY